MAESSATPLVGLDAVALDTETTGLDPARARIVEIGLVPLAGGALDEAAARRWLVRPDTSVPAAAAAIHGLDDAKLASAPSFAEIWPEVSAFIGERVVVGHDIGFDLAVLRGECVRANLEWTAPRTLCTRLLAEAAGPGLAGYSLEQIAAWLEVQPGPRHAAVGDAVTAGRIFLALVHPLREQGIRTLAEAESASRALTEILDRQYQAGWIEPVIPAASRDRLVRRLDTHPFRNRIGELMSTAQVAAADISIAEAIAYLARERISSVFLRLGSDAGATMRSETAMIVTERDLLRAIAEHGAAALTMPAASVASSPVLTVAADTFLYRGIARMRNLKVRHLGVADEDGRLVGAVSARDLLKQRGEEAVWLGDEIDEAADVPGLARAWTRIPLLAESLLGEDMPGGEVSAVISRELGALSRRAAVLAERRMRDTGAGAPPEPYALAVLGSAGRGESLLAMDQDNALVFAAGEPDGAADRWFAVLAMHVADILHEAGVPYCKGGVMAKNTAWRGSAATWGDRVGRWIRRSNPQDLLSVDIFFELRGVHGDLMLTSDLRREAFDAAEGQAGFAKLLAEAAGTGEQGLNWLGRIRTEQGRIDLKKAGLFAIVTAARVLAIRHHVTDRSTLGRLKALEALGIGSAADLAALIDAHGVFMTLIQRQQLDDIAQGVPASNAVIVKRLARRQQADLRAALEAVRHADEMTRDLLFKT